MAGTVRDVTPVTRLKSSRVTDAFQHIYASAAGFPRKTRHQLAPFLSLSPVLVLPARSTFSTDICPPSDPSVSHGLLCTVQCVNETPSRHVISYHL
jgi:hypothetical protein